MVLYGITLVPLDGDLRAAGLGLISPFNANDTTFYGSAQQSAQILKMLMNRGLDRRYFLEPAKSLFILDTLGQVEAARREFSA